MKNYYLDHAATTPLDGHVIEAMLPYMTTYYGNPSSIHHAGMLVKRAINEARMHVAELFGVQDKGVIFTSGGTESTNLAIRGYAQKHPQKKEIITSVIEHHATLHTLEELQKEGYMIHYLPVNHEGFIDIELLKNTLNDQTLMVSIIWANNEIGTIQDVKKIGQLCHEKGVKLHVDAVQMVAHFNVSFHDYPIDFLSLSAHKFYGPKGMGTLVVRDDSDLSPIIFGGHQERGIRSGTENVYGIIGLAAALKLKSVNSQKRYDNLLLLTERFKTLASEYPDIIINGPKDQNMRLPGLLSLSFPNVESQSMAFALDQKGIYVSNGSACLSNEVTESHVLKAIGVSPDVGTIRMSFGKDTLIDDLPDVWDIIKDVYEEIKED
ncbi:MAG: cysteine desulfurase family protein [Acholeplasmataceae bacterium]|jgi:cysteine desulfurase|nr:cysteine desulfurase family protein [Acholeplasmataceae bacterium]